MSGGQGVPVRGMALRGGCSIPLWGSLLWGNPIAEYFPLRSAM